MALRLHTPVGEEGLAADRRRMQWLFEGYTDADVDLAAEPPGMVKSMREVLELRGLRSERGRAGKL